ncbi:LPS assembly lipoprotein LptE [Calditrichota bacterium]
MKYLISCICIFMIGIAGCGVYSFTGGGIAGVETLAVEPFTNRDPEFGLEDQLVDAVVQRLLSDRTYTIANMSTADAILRGVITDVDDRTISFSKNEEAEENEVKITLEIQVIKPGKSEPLKETRLVATGVYPYETGNPDERQAGINKAIDQLVLDLFNWLTSDW